MSKKQTTGGASKLNLRPQPTAPSGPSAAPATGSWLRAGQEWSFRLVCILIAVFTFALYGNTLKNEYAMDDELVTMANERTTQGVSQIPAIFTNPYFELQGHKYEYRPIVLASFAIEHQFFNPPKADGLPKPSRSHFINLLLYLFTGILLYKVLRKLFPNLSQLFSLLATFLFIAHPLHTEAVASIKNRDEILCMLGGLGALFYALRLTETNNYRFLIGVTLCFAFAVLSKRSIIPYAVIIPLAMTLLTRANFSQVYSVSMITAALAVFIAPLFFVFESISFFAALVAFNSAAFFAIRRLFQNDNWRQTTANLLDSVSPTEETQGGLGLKLFWALSLPLAALSVLSILYFARIGIVISAVGFLGLALWANQESRKAAFSLLALGFSALSIGIGQYGFGLIGLGLLTLAALENRHLVYPAAIVVCGLALGLVPLIQLGSISFISLGVFYVAFYFLAQSESAQRRKVLLGVYGALALVFLGAYVVNPRPVNFYFFILSTFPPLYLLVKGRKIARRVLTPLLFVYAVSFLFIPNIDTLGLQPFQRDKNSVIPESNRSLDQLESPMAYETSFSIKLANGFYVLGEYARLLVAPHPLGFYYGYDQIKTVKTWWDFQVIWSALLHLSLAALAVLAIRRLPFVSFFLFYYLFCIVIFSNVAAPVAGILGERLAYVSSLGFCALLAYGILKAFRIPFEQNETAKNENKNAPSLPAAPLYKPFFAVCALILLLYSGKTISRNFDWKDHLTLYRHDIKYLTRSTQAHQLLGNRLMNAALAQSDSLQKRALLLESRVAYRKSIEIDPRYFASVNNLSTVYRMLYMDDSARFFLEKAVKIEPRNAETHFNLASCYQTMGDLDKAIVSFQNALTYDSTNIEVAYTNLSYVYFKKGEYEKSIQTNLRAIKNMSRNGVRPFHPYNNIGKVYFHLKDYPNAVKYLEEAFKIDPTVLGLPQTLSLCYRYMGDKEKEMYYAQQSERYSRLSQTQRAAQPNGKDGVYR